MSQSISQQESMIRGTFWSTIGNFASRLMGAIYIIPWFFWMGTYGNQANALFGMGYTIYSIFLSISTAGVNVAMAKQVSKYHSLGQEKTSFQLVRTSLLFVIILGVISASIMYLGSPWLAKMSGIETELIPVLRSLSWSVLVFPAMSVIRGFFQGLNNLKPFAMSQMLEQLVRVIWMLATTFLIMQLGSADYVKAVTQSTFAAFVGMLFGMAILGYYLWKENLIQPIFQKYESSSNVDSKAVLLETMKEAIPFIITGAAIQIFQLIDQFTFINSMTLLTDYSQEQLEVMFSYFGANPNKVYMILIAVAVSIGGVGIPLLTENTVKKQTDASAKLVVDSLTMLLVFLLPAVIGVTLLAKPVYIFFYGIPDNTALGLFILAMLQALILGLYTVLAPVLQALFENRNAVIFFLYGTIVKLLLQFPMIWLFKAYGPLLATGIGLMVPVVLMYQRIRKLLRIDHQLVLSRGYSILLQTLVMGLIVLVVEFLLNQIIPVNSRLMSIVHLVICGGMGVAIYTYLSLLTHSADFLVGKHRANSLRQQIGLK